MIPEKVPTVSQGSLVAATAAAAAVFLLYAWTLPRGLINVGVDTAKFSYAARVLAVPQAPGYPIYMLIGWAFSWLPVGTLAFRMHLLSACFGAATVGLLVLLFRELRCSRLTATLVAWLAGTGRLFWSQAIIAEVYTMHTTLIAGMLLAVVTWQRTRRRTAIYLAALCFGLGLAHHTDIAFFGPALAIYVAATDRRALRDLRLIAVVTAIVAAALSSYAYVIIRTRQGAAFLGNRAESIADVFALMFGRPYQHLLFQSSAVDVIRHRAPYLAKFFLMEIGLTGLSLCLLGLSFLVRDRRALFALVTLSAAAMMAFTLNYHAGDVEVFLIPVFVLCWICVAVGLNGLHYSLLGDRGSRANGALTAFVCLWAVWQTLGNFGPNNLRQHTYDARFFDRLFEALPNGSAIIDDSIETAQSVLYKVLGEGGQGKQVTLVISTLPGSDIQFSAVRNSPAHRVLYAGLSDLDRLRGEGHHIFVFQQMSRRLRTAGFFLAPIQLPDRPLPHYLSALDPGLIVAVAVPANASEGLRTVADRPFAAIGGATRMTRGQCQAVVGVSGERRGATQIADAEAHVVIGTGTPIGPGQVVAPVDIKVDCDGRSVGIAINGVDVSRSQSSIPLLVLDATGSVLTATTVAADTGYRVPLDWSPQPIYRIDPARTCRSVPSTWTNVTPVADAAVAVHLPATASMRTYFAADSAMSIRPSRDNESPVTLHTTATDTLTADGRERLRTMVAMDSLDSAAVAGHRYVTRVDVRRQDGGAGAVALLIGAARPVAYARMVDAVTSGEMCRATLGDHPLFATCSDCLERIELGQTRDEWFGPGWSGFEPDSGGGVRRILSEESHLLLPMARAGSMRFEIRAVSPGTAAGAGQHLRLAVNGHELPPIEMVPAWYTYHWFVPADVSRQGVVNDVTIAAGERGHEIAVRAITATLIAR